MKCFDPYLKADALQDSDLANLAYFGVAQVILVSHAPRTFAREGDLIAYWEDLLEREVARFERHNITARVALGGLAAAHHARRGHRRLQSVAAGDEMQTAPMNE